MKFDARILSADGVPLAKAGVVMVVPTSRGPQELARGVVVDGALSMEAEPGPVWGLVVDGRPILAFAVFADDATADLGNIAFLAQGVRFPAFHAPDGVVFGVPAALRGQAGREESIIADPTTPPIISPAPQPLPENGDTTPIRSALTMGGLVGSAAQQLSAAALPESTVRMTGATVKLKGIPTMTEDALGLAFPSEQLAATGAGLSEISFTLLPQIEMIPPPRPPQPTGPKVPNLVGYTRELATRKLAAMGMIGEVHNEITRDPARAGRVIRHIPAAGAAASDGTVVRLFVGKHGGA